MLKKLNVIRIIIVSVFLMLFGLIFSCINRNNKTSETNEDNNSISEEQEKELEQLERDSQKMLDDKIIAVGGGLLGLTVGFINTIKSSIQANIMSGFLFLGVILALSITISYSVYSHYYSAFVFRMVNEKWFHNKHPDFNIENASKRIRQLNAIQVFGFILTIILMVLLIFVISSSNSIWVVKSIIFSFLCLTTAIIYYLVKNKLKLFWVRLLVNIILSTLFIKGSFLLWLIKPTNQIIQILSK